MKSFLIVVCVVGVFLYALASADVGSIHATQNARHAVVSAL